MFRGFLCDGALVFGGRNVLANRRRIIINQTEFTPARFDSPGERDERTNKVGGSDGVAKYVQQYPNLSTAEEARSSAIFPFSASFPSTRQQGHAVRVGPTKQRSAREKDEINLVDRGDDDADTRFENVSRTCGA